MVKIIRGAPTKKLPMILLSIFISILLITGGWFYYQIEKGRIKNEKFKYLKTVSEFKISQLIHWKKERLADAELYSQRLSWINYVYAYKSGKAEKLKEQILKQFDFIIDNYDVDNILLISPDFQIIECANKNYAFLDSGTVDYVKTVLKRKSIVARDFHLYNNLNRLNYEVYAPMFDNDREVVAVLLLQINPHTYLFPLIQSWPDSNGTSETLIVRKQGDNVLFLNELRKINNTSLKLYFPLTKTNIPAVQAVLGYTGIFEGKDYTGTEVFSYLSPVPTTDWYMVAKVDKNEIFADLYYIGGVIGIFVITLILFTGISITLVYHSRQKKIYKELYINENNLNRVQKEYRAILYSIGDAVLTTDLNGNIMNMNPVAEKLTGVTEQQYQGRRLEDVFNIVDENSRDKIDNPVQNVLASGKTIGMTNHTLLLSKDGREIPIADSGAPIFDESGNITGVVLVFRDQTKERQIQNSLKESEERYRKLFTSTNDGLCLHEIIKDEYGKAVDYRILDINPKYETITGMHRENIIGMPASKIYGTGHPPYLEIYSKVAETSEPVVFETYFEPMDKYFHISVFSPGEQKFATVFQDITERKKNEKMVIESERRYRSLFENMLNGFAYCKMIFENGEPADFIYISVNRAFETLTGLKNIIGKKVTEIIPRIRETNKELFDIYGNVAITGIPDKFETYVDGLDMWFSISVYSPKKEFFVAVFDVITDRKRAEEEIKILNMELEKKVELRTKQLEETNKELEAFAYSVSHDLRSPLRAIDGFTRILTEDYGTKLDSEGQRVCKVIQENSIWMGRLIDDLLSFSRLNKSEIKKIPVNMSEMVNSAFKEIVREVQVNRIEFNIGDLNPAKCDATMIKQVWINLIGNALKFSSKVDHPVISIGCELKKDQIVYFVKDNGVGFNMKYVDKLFNVFQRLHSVKEFEGTGVGLAIVKRVVNKHGGEVWAEGKENHGAEFYFSLPIET